MSSASNPLSPTFCSGTCFSLTIAHSLPLRFVFLWFGWELNIGLSLYPLPAILSFAFHKTEHALRQRIPSLLVIEVCFLACSVAQNGTGIPLSVLCLPFHPLSASLFTRTRSLIMIPSLGHGGLFLYAPIVSWPPVFYNNSQYLQQQVTFVVVEVHWCLNVL